MTKRNPLHRTDVIEYTWSKFAVACTRLDKKTLDKHGPALMAYWRGRMLAEEARTLGVPIEGDKS